MGGIAVQLTDENESECGEVMPMFLLDVVIGLEADKTHFTACNCAHVPTITTNILLSSDDASAAPAHATRFRDTDIA